MSSETRATCSCGLCHASEFQGMTSWLAKPRGLGSFLTVSRRCLPGREPYADEYDGHCPRDCGDLLTFDEAGQPVARAMTPKATTVSRAAFSRALEIIGASSDCPWVEDGTIPCIGGKGEPDNHHPDHGCTDADIAACWGRFLETPPREKVDDDANPDAAHNPK